jgi:hypothetical protein
MKAPARVISTMVPPVVKAPRLADRIGILAATAPGGFAWTLTRLLRGLHRLDAWLSRHHRQHRQENA